MTKDDRRTILVTGSIETVGSEVVKQLASHSLDYGIIKAGAIVVWSSSGNSFQRDWQNDIIRRYTRRRRSQRNENDGFVLS